MAKWKIILATNLRNDHFDSIILPKHKRDISTTIDDKVGKIGRLQRSILKGSTGNIRLRRTTFW